MLSVPPPNGGVAGNAGPPKIAVPGFVEISISTWDVIDSLSAIFLITRLGLLRISCVIVLAAMNGLRS